MGASCSGIQPRCIGGREPTLLDYHTPPSTLYIYIGIYIMYI